MKLAILGPPGSGKGTYASRMSPKLDIPQISTGDLLRAARDDPEHGAAIKEAQDSGGLVSDEIVLELLKKRLEQKDAKKGFILDGFPRTLEQAKALQGFAKLDAVINLVVPDEVVIARLSSRRSCKECNEIYNTLFLKPKEEGKCDKCGGDLYQRSDDKPEAIKHRLKVYTENTAPLIDYYSDEGVRIDIPCNSVDVPPETQVEKIMNALKEKGLID
ncbi:MAG TPA: nucleoside monophosphate kinase [Candidatus Woesearchaeota archaeon]|nr:nucleoside monophosphate kinase [Candidatus Woesearchaeota archaeon]